MSIEVIGLFFVFPQLFLFYSLKFFVSHCLLKTFLGSHKCKQDCYVNFTYVQAIKIRAAYILLSIIIPLDMVPTNTYRGVNSNLIINWQIAYRTIL